MNKNAAAVSRLRIYMVFWAFLIIAFASVIYIQVKKEKSFTGDITTLTEQLNAAIAEQHNLQLAVDSKTSDKSVEDYAHSQLGLVYPNEIIFYVDN